MDMLKPCLLVLVVSLSLACSPRAPETSQDAAETFHALLDKHWAAARTEKIYFRSRAPLRNRCGAAEELAAREDVGGVENDCSPSRRRVPGSLAR